MSALLVQTPRYIEEDRQKQGGLSIPPDAQEQMKKVVEKAFADMKAALEKYKIEVAPMLEDHTKDVASDLVKILETLHGMWIKKSGYSYALSRSDDQLKWATFDEVSRDIATYVRRVFGNTISDARFYWSIIQRNSEFYFILGKCENRIITELTALAAKWK